MNKDWVGNKKSIFTTLGASNHTDKEREENDYYATDPEAAIWLHNIEQLSDILLEPACGEGHLSKQLEAFGHEVVSIDLIDRGYGYQGDFFEMKEWNFDIVTNPPYKHGLEFIKHALDIIPIGNKVCMFMKIQFLEGKARKKFFQEFPPIRIWVSSSRIMCAKNGDFEGMKAGGGSAVGYAWYIWEKGYTGDTTIKWFN